MPSLSFYYNRPQWKNDPMGERPVLRALVEMIDAPAYTEIKAEQQYDKIKQRLYLLVTATNVFYSRRLYLVETLEFNKQEDVYKRQILK